LSNREAEESEKIILIGLAESGKTTIIRVITEGYVPDKKAEYAATLDYERKKITLFGRRLTFFDLGGQKAFLDRFTGELAQFMFSKIKAMIFVVDVVNVSILSRVKYYLDLALDNLNLYSPTALVYVFLHKTDLINKENVKDFSIDKKEDYTKNMKTFLKANLPDPDPKRPITFFETSIFTESIFNVFGSIFSDITIKHKQLNIVLNNFAKENSGTVKTIQLFSENGVPLLDTSNNVNLSLKQTRKLVENTVQGISDSNDKVKSTIIELEENIYVVRYLDDGNVLFLHFLRKGMKRSNENIPSIINKVIVLTKKLNSLNSEWDDSFENLTQISLNETNDK
jgi:GTPase SAR1 family protein